MRLMLALVTATVNAIILVPVVTVTAMEIVMDAKMAMVMVKGMKRISDTATALQTEMVLAFTVKSDPQNGKLCIK
jgi:hypothetical protein